MIGKHGVRCFLPPPCPVFVYRLWITPGAEFRENSRERGRRSLSYRRQGSEAPLGAQTSAKQSAEARRAGRRGGTARAAGRGLPGAATCAGAEARRRAFAGHTGAGAKRARVEARRAEGCAWARGGANGLGREPAAGFFECGAGTLWVRNRAGAGLRASKRLELAGGPGKKALFPARAAGGAAGWGAPELFFRAACEGFFRTGSSRWQRVGAKKAPYAHI